MHLSPFSLSLSVCCFLERCKKVVNEPEVKAVDDLVINLLELRALNSSSFILFLIAGLKNFNVNVIFY